MLAVEVLRQTPLQDVRFLDIIGITRGKEGLRRGRSEECLTTTRCQTNEPPTLPTVAPEQKPQRNKYNFKEECKKKKERPEFSQWLHCVKRETVEENRAKNMDFDMKNMKIRRAQKVRPKLPFAETWNKLRGLSRIEKSLEKESDVLHTRSMSMDDLRKHQRSAEPSLCSCNEEKTPVSDESGISSGDENINTISDTSIKSEKAATDTAYVSVREKKKFFESLGGDVEPKRVEVHLNRSSSIGNINVGPQPPPALRSGQRASSMHDLSSNGVPVKAMRRFFEGGSDVTKRSDELRFQEDDTGSTIVEEDEGSSENDGREGFKQAKGSKRSTEQDKRVNTPFVKPVVRKPEETVSYANIQFCRTDVQSANSAKVLRDRDVRASLLNYPAELKETSVKELGQGVKKKLIPNYEEGGQEINQKLICKIKATNDRNLPKIVEQGTFSRRSEKSNRSASETSSISGDNPRDNNMSTLLAQRKLQRGERKLGKLRIQIAEVEETIKHIAEDLHSIGPDTLKRYFL